jgi:hypothetical protein
MRWIVSLSIVLMACGGPQIPTHNGYKPKEAKPWKKPKTLKLDDKLEAKVEGDVSYPDMRRARWFQVELPENGQLTLMLEITPPGDAVNDDFDLGMEVLDPSLRVISKSDLETEDAYELTKKKTLVDLPPGKYLIHLYLQGRMDTADFVLHASFKPTAAGQARGNFPAEVPFIPELALVPIQDDTPRNYKPPTPPPANTSRRGAGPRTRTAPTPTPTPTPAPPATVTARIINVQVVSGGTLITVGRGKDTGASDGMMAKINGFGEVQIGNCNARTCTATVKATPDQLKSANGTVTLHAP